MRQLMMAGNDPATWRNKRRRAVLGFWHELKQEYWKQAHGYCEPTNDNTPTVSPVSQETPVSAYIVSEECINRIVYARALMLGLTPERIEAFGTSLGRMLLTECIASVAARYPNDKPGERPGPQPNPTPEGYVYAHPVGRGVPLTCERVLLTGPGTPEWKESNTLLKDAIHEYRYQSCEHNGWQDSAACYLTAEILGYLTQWYSGRVVS